MLSFVDTFSRLAPETIEMSMWTLLARESRGIAIKGLSLRAAADSSFAFFLRVMGGGRHGEVTVVVSSLRGGVRTAIRPFGPNIDNTASPCIKSSESTSMKVQLEDVKERLNKGPRA
jgi:hypothetical protein